jgi:hypothetical protein
MTSPVPSSAAYELASPLHPSAVLWRRAYSAWLCRNGFLHSEAATRRFCRIFQTVGVEAAVMGSRGTALILDLPAQLGLLFGPAKGRA